MKTQPDLIAAIIACEPTAHCSCRGEQVYSNVVWNPEVDPAKIPSQADVEAKLVELIAEWTANQYQRDRQYPSIGDQLDMQYHDELNGTTTWKDAIAKVKSDNPKA